MRKDIFVYISGPMTAKGGFSIEENLLAGAQVFFYLLKHDIPCYCPHLTGLLPSAWTLMSHEKWLEYDYAVIDRSTHVLMMDRWETSSGACLEKMYAEKIGIPIIYSIDDLPSPHS